MNPSATRASRVPSGGSPASEAHASAASFAKLPTALGMSSVSFAQPNTKAVVSPHARRRYS